MIGSSRKSLNGWSTLCCKGDKLPVTHRRAMPEAGKTPDTVRFGPFELWPETGELHKFDVRVKLPVSQSILILLVKSPGRLVAREELACLWGEDTFRRFREGIERRCEPAAGLSRRFRHRTQVHRDSSRSRVSVHRQKLNRSSFRPGSTSSPAVVAAQDHDCCCGLHGCWRFSLPRGYDRGCRRYRKTRSRPEFRCCLGESPFADLSKDTIVLADL